MTHSFPSKDYGIDLTLSEVVRRNNGRLFESAYRLDLQVKCTASVVETGTAIGYDLPIKAYDDLRFVSSVARILTVLVIPPDEADWLRQTGTKLEVRKCMYWLSLRGCLAVRNRSSVRVVIPKRQMFTPAALGGIMQSIRGGKMP